MTYYFSINKYSCVQFFKFIIHLFIEREQEEKEGKRHADVNDLYVP